MIDPASQAQLKEAIPFAYSILIAFTWALAEPIVIAAFGTTPGKAILNIRLTNRSNEDFSWDKVDMGVLYQRSMAVWIKGMGMGIPLVSLASQLTSYKNLKSQGETSWDRDYGFAVTHGEVSYAMGGLAATILVFAMILNAAGNGSQEYQMSAAAQQPVTSQNVKFNADGSLNLDQELGLTPDKVGLNLDKELAKETAPSPKISDYAK